MRKVNPIIFATTLSIILIIHKQVAKRISFSVTVNSGNMLLRNIGKSFLLLVGSLLFAQILFSTGILEDKLF